MSEIATVEEIIGRVDIWKGKEVTFEPLSGGITNHNYICHCDGGKYVLRVPGTGTDTFIDRQVERSSSIAAAKAGVSPEILFTVQPEDAVVIPFIEGEVMHPETIAANDGHIVSIIKAVRRVHEKAVFESKTDVFEMTRNYIRMAEEVKAFFPDDFKWMRDISDRMEKAMDRDRPEPAACHNDLLSENFILAPDGKMWILDWEYGGMNDPYFDLGDFSVEHPLNAEQNELIIRTYCGELLPHRFNRMMLHRMTADLWWCQWAMIQDRISKIDFDFYTYGLGRYSRFRDNYYNRDFEKWVAGV